MGKAVISHSSGCGNLGDIGGKPQVLSSALKAPMDDIRVSSSETSSLSARESNAIMMYAADLKGSSAYPKDLKQRATVNRWLLWEASVWFGSCYVLLVQNVVQELLGGKPDQAAIDKELPNWHKLAGILDDQLGKTKWLAGDEVTIADIAVAAPMHLWEDSKMPLDEHPNLKRWIQQVEKLPEWQKTQGAVEKALTPNKHKSSNQVRATFNYTKDLGDKLTELYFFESEQGCISA